MSFQSSEISGTFIAHNALFLLLQHIEFKGRSDAFFSSGNPKSKNESAIVAHAQHGSIAAGQSDYWDNEPLNVPSLPPSKLTNCRFINISYVVKVTGF